MCFLNTTGQLVTIKMCSYIIFLQQYEHCGSFSYQNIFPTKLQQVNYSLGSRKAKRDYKHTSVCQHEEFPTTQCYTERKNIRKVYKVCVCDLVAVTSRCTVVQCDYRKQKVCVWACVGWSLTCESKYLMWLLPARSLDDSWRSKSQKPDKRLKERFMQK